MTQTEIADFLKSTKLCEEFSDSEIKKIAAVSRLQSFLANEQIFEDGDNKDHINNFYIVLSGDIQISKVFTHKGISKNQLLNILKSGDCFGEIALLKKHTTRTAAVSCLTPSKLLIIDKRDFLDIYYSNRKFVENLLMIFIDYLNHSNNVSRFMMFSAKDASRRLMYMIDFFKCKYGIPQDERGYLITLPFSNVKVAELLGMKLQLYSRCKSKLRDEGLLTGSGKNFIIEDYQKFNNLLYGDGIRY